MPIHVQRRILGQPNEAALPTKPNYSLLLPAFFAAAQRLRIALRILSLPAALILPLIPRLFRVGTVFDDAGLPRLATVPFRAVMARSSRSRSLRNWSRI